jgi:regulator of protease activity HflC (stomatin/prohibitin superfamily)
MKVAIASTAAFVGFVVFITVFFGSWYTVDQTERGVLLRNGALIGVVEPGLHFKLPLIDGVHKISVQQGVYRGGALDRVQAYSRDQQPAVMQVSVNYQVTDPSKLYVGYQTEGAALQREVYPKVTAHLKTVFGQFNAVTAIQERARLNQEVEGALQMAMQGLPITVVSVQIENIDFSNAYEQSIEARMLAEVDVQKIQQNLAREQIQAQITVTQATAAANSSRAAGQAAADNIRVRGAAEADAIRARAEALRQNQDLVKLQAVEKWNGVLPATMLPNSTVPFISVGAP